MEETNTRTVTKVLAVEEDLLLGEGSAQQTRQGTSYTVTKISGFRPVNTTAELTALDTEKFPKAVLVQNGFYTFYQYNGIEYEAIRPTETNGKGFYPVSTPAELAALDNSIYPYAVLVENNTYRFYKYDGASYVELIPLSKVATYVTDTSSYSAASLRTLFFNVAAPHSITNLTGGIQGQEINIVALTANTTIDNNANIVLISGGNLLIPVDTGLRLVYTGTAWAQV